MESNKYFCKQCYKTLNDRNLCEYCDDESCYICGDSMYFRHKICITCHKNICEDCIGIYLNNNFKCYYCYDYRCENCGDNLEERDDIDNIKTYHYLDFCVNCASHISK